MIGDVIVDINFSNELEEKRKKLIKHDKAKEILNHKDDIIWSLLQEKKIEEEKQYALMKEKAKEDITEWKRLSEKYSSQLEQYILVCHFCGCFLEEESMNNQCMINLSSLGENKNNKLIYYTDSVIPMESIGNKRHYFAKPSNDYYEKMNNAISNTHKNHKLNDERVHMEEQQLEAIKEENELRKREKREKEQILDKEAIYKDKDRLKTNDTGKITDNALTDKENKYFNKTTNLDLAGIYDKIKYHSKRLGIDFEKQIGNFFMGKNQTSFDELKLFLATKFELSEPECNRFLSQIVSNPPQIGSINIYSGYSSISNREQQIGSPINTNISGQMNSTPFKTERNYNNESPNKKVLVDDFISLLKRSNDFSSLQKSNKFNQQQQELNIFEKEREMLNHNKYKLEVDNSSKNRYNNTPTKQQNNFYKDTIIKLVSHIRLMKINLYQLLSEDETDGKISKEVLLKVLNNMDLRLSSRDLMSLLDYLKIDSKSINIQRFIQSIIDSYEKYTF